MKWRCPQTHIHSIAQNPQVLSHAVRASLSLPASSSSFGSHVQICHEFAIRRNQRLRALHYRCAWLFTVAPDTKRVDVRVATCRSRGQTKTKAKAKSPCVPRLDSDTGRGKNILNTHLLMVRLALSYIDRQASTMETTRGRQAARQARERGVADRPSVFEIPSVSLQNQEHHTVPAAANRATCSKTNRTPAHITTRTRRYGHIVLSYI
jgi:hypothetical protein